jgi:hypothetical protein
VELQRHHLLRGESARERERAHPWQAERVGQDVDQSRPEVDARGERGRRVGDIGDIRDVHEGREDREVLDGVRVRRLHAPCPRRLGRWVRGVAHGIDESPRLDALEDERDPQDRREGGGPSEVLELGFHSPASGRRRVARALCAYSGDFRHLPPPC